MNEKTKDSYSKIEEANIRYHNSEKGKAAKKRYDLSLKGKSAREKYLRSEKGKAALLRYYLSEKGEATRKRHGEMVSLCNQLAKYLEKNPTKTVGDFLNQQKGDTD